MPVGDVDIERYRAESECRRYVHKGSHSKRNSASECLHAFFTAATPATAADPVAAWS